MLDVSVIIPARNRAAYIEQSLHLLSRQTHPSDAIEVLLIDDGSSDRTPELVAGNRYPFTLRYEVLPPTSEDFWAARPRNAGLALAAGRIAIFLDSDVFVARDFVEEHVRLHEGGAGHPRVGIGQIYGTAFDNEARSIYTLKPPAMAALAEQVGERGEPPPDWLDGRADYMKRWPILALCPFPWHFFWTGNVSVPVSPLRAAGGFDEGFRGWGGEDTDLGYRLFSAGAEFRWAPRAWGVHYPHPVRPAAEREVLANCRRLLRKHPGATMEAVLWSIRFAERDEMPHRSSVEQARIAVLEELCLGHGQAAGDEPCPCPSELVRYLLDVAGSRSPRGDAPATLWSGSSPAGLSFPAVAHVPGVPATSATAGSVGPLSLLVCPRLLGLATGWEDGTFALAVAADHWAAMPDRLLAPIVRELSRISSTVVFLLRSQWANEKIINEVSSTLKTQPHRILAGGQEAVLAWTLPSAARRDAPS